MGRKKTYKNIVFSVLFLIGHQFFLWTDLKKVQHLEFIEES